MEHGYHHQHAASTANAHCIWGGYYERMKVVAAMCVANTLQFQVTKQFRATKCIIGNDHCMKSENCVMVVVPFTAVRNGQSGMLWPQQPTLNHPAHISIRHHVNNNIYVKGLPFSCATLSVAVLRS